MHVLANIPFFFTIHAKKISTEKMFENVNTQIIKYLLHQCISTIISYTFILQFSQSGYTSPFKYSQVWIYTTTSSAACGVQLDIGKTYVITGPKRDTKLTANTCSWNVEVSALTSFQRNALRKDYYRKNCECKVCNCIVQQLARATYFNVLSY